MAAQRRWYGTTVAALDFWLWLPHPPSSHPAGPANMPHMNGKCDPLAKFRARGGLCWDFRPCGAGIPRRRRHQFGRGKNLLGAVPVVPPLVAVVVSAVFFGGFGFSCRHIVFEWVLRPGGSSHSCSMPLTRPSSPNALICGGKPSCENPPCTQQLRSPNAAALCCLSKCGKCTLSAGR